MVTLESVGFVAFGDDMCKCLDRRWCVREARRFPTMVTFRGERFRSESKGQVMQIGEPLRTIVVEPLELPVNEPPTAPEPEPAWGTVVEHELGWRAQYACPKNFSLPLEMVPVSMSLLEARIETLAAYGCDIHVLDKERNVALWVKGAGYDAVGLDLLVQRCESWYAVRQKDRRIKRGDRVAVLGRGITVVEQLGDKEILALLWNREVLRISRKAVAWNQRNMRWEASRCLDTRGDLNLDK